MQKGVFKSLTRVYCVRVRDCEAVIGQVRKIRPERVLSDARARAASATQCERHAEHLVVVTLSSI